jgi:hypothetical protein
VVSTSVGTVVQFLQGLGSPQVGRDFGILYTGNWLVPKSVETVVPTLQGARWPPVQ